MLIDVRHSIMDHINSRQVPCIVQFSHRTFEASNSLQQYGTDCKPELQRTAYRFTLPQ